MDRSATDTARFSSASKLGWAPVALLAFVLILSALTYRAFGGSSSAIGDTRGWLLHDFGETVYYPTRAVLDGRNPYDASTYVHLYPVERPFPPFAPVSLALYAPFAVADPALAGQIWYAFTVLLTVVLAWVALRGAGQVADATSVLGVAALILASRPGHANLLNGQQTLVVVLGAYAALLHAKSWPWLAAVGVALSTLKPQFGVPFGLLLAAGGHFRVAALGAALVGLGSLAVLLSLPAGADTGPIGTFLETCLGSASRIDEKATTWWSQIDARYLLHHVIGESSGLVDDVVSLLLLAMGALTVRHLARRDAPGDSGLAIGVTCLTTLLCIYHQSYDALLLTLPLLLLVVGRGAPPWDRHPLVRVALAVLLAVPAVNYLATFHALDRLGITGGWWLVVTALNAAALLVALSLYVATSLSPRPRAETRMMPRDAAARML